MPRKSHMVRVDFVHDGQSHQSHVVEVDTPDEERAKMLALRSFAEVVLPPGGYTMAQIVGYC